MSNMVAALLKKAILVVETPQSSKKNWHNRQNVFSEHQNASTADALTDSGGFCKKIIDLIFFTISP